MTSRRLSRLTLLVLLAATGAWGSTIPTASQGDKLYSPIQSLIAGVSSQQSVMANALFSGSAVSFTPEQSSQIFNILDISGAFPVLSGSTRNSNLAVGGRLGQGRFIAWGSNLPERVQAGAQPASSSTLFANSLSAVLNQTPAQLPNARRVAIALMTGQELTRTQQWLQNRYPQWTLVSCTDPVTLTTCITGASLVLAADSAPDPAAVQVSTSLTANLRRGIPLVYLHNRWSTNAVSDRLAAALGVEMPYAGNYFNQDSAQWSTAASMLAAESTLKQISRLIGHLQNHDFPAFDWSQCTSSVGTTSCDNVPGLTQEFGLAASAVRNSLKSLEQAGIVINRSADQYQLLKQLVRLGDTLRSGIRYPLDKQTSGNEAFFKAYLADHLNSYLRTVNLRVNDTGTFSAPLPVSTPTFSRDLVIDLAAASQNRSTGLYALPGMPVKVTRLDTGTGNVGLYLNSIRSGSTRVWNTNGLARPKFIQSPVFPVTTSALTFSSPYGGPVYLSVPGGTGQIRVRLTGVAAYAYLSGLDNPAAVTGFAATLSATPFSWAGIRTDFVDINSRTSMLRNTINAAPYNGDLTKALGDVWTYMIKGTYELAGFSGSGLHLPTAVLNRCVALNWDCTNTAIHAKPAVQHITVDTMANCGSGCSGNPYDQDWALAPIGWGETHEIGHNLQRSRLKIFGGKTTEVSNNIFPSYKGWQYFQATGTKADHCGRGNDAKLYTWLQEARNSADPTTTMYNRLWSQTGIYDNAFERLGFYLQLAYAADTLPALNNGWQIFTLMYLHDRLFNDALKDSTTWNNNRAKLGFGTYATAPTSMDGNDFMVISYSFLTGKDQRALFNAWGITFSASASQQVASLNLPVAPVLYYSATEHCSTLKIPAYPVDGVTTLP